MIKVSFAKILKILVITFVVLFTFHVFFYVAHTVIYHYSPENTNSSGLGDLIFTELMTMFDMNQEQNFPTLYNTVILLFSAFLLTLIASNEEKKRDKWLWGGMALIFFYIGVDDFTTFHEGIFHHLVPDYSGTGFLKYGWVIPYGIIILLVIVVYFRHIFRIPKKIRNKMILAGAVFVTGGFVMEMVGGYFTTHGYYLLFRTSVTLEETGEMVGILIFIDSLIGYLKLKNKNIQFYHKSQSMWQLKRRSPKLQEKDPREIEQKIEAN